MQKIPTIRKEPAGNHRYGPDMTLHGSVYCAYDGERLVCYAATAGEARRKYAKAEWADRQRKPVFSPQISE